MEDELGAVANSEWQPADSEEHEYDKDILASREVATDPIDIVDNTWHHTLLPCLSLRGLQLNSWISIGIFICSVLQ